MNLTGYWHSDDQVRVGEYEKRVFDEKKNFAGKVTKDCQKRMIAFEGLQPMVAEAFLKGDNIQCGLDAVKNSNEEWTFWIAFNLIGFAAVILVLFKIYKHFEISYFSVADADKFQFDYMDTLVKRVEKRLDEVEERVGIMEFGERKNLKTNSTFYKTLSGEFTVDWF